MKGQELKEQITGLVREYVSRYPGEHHTKEIWRTPLVGFADVNHPAVRNLPFLVTDTHQLPEDFLADATVIVSYFIPFTKELASTNVGVRNHEASREWSEAYTLTNQMMAQLNLYLTEELTVLGFHAAVPQNAGMVESLLKSRWSQRHLAYAAGLGTFGINNMLIGPSGCCGRYNSIVANLPVEPDSPLTEENCLYKSRGLCKKCVQNCFSGALTVDGFDRVQCHDTCEKNKALYGNDVCGKCVTDIPCAFAAPGR